MLSQSLGDVMGSKEDVPTMVSLLSGGLQAAGCWPRGLSVAHVALRGAQSIGSHVLSPHREPAVKQK